MTINENENFGLSKMQLDKVRLHTEFAWLMFTMLQHIKKVKICFNNYITTMIKRTVKAISNRNLQPTNLDNVSLLIFVVCSVNTEFEHL